MPDETKTGSVSETETQTGPGSVPQPRDAGQPAEPPSAPRAEGSRGTRAQERKADEQTDAAREAQQEVVSRAAEPDDESDDAKQAREQNEAARNAQAQAFATGNAVQGGFGGESLELPRGTRAPKVGDDVYYGLDHDGIVEWVSAKVTDTDPNSGQKVSQPWSEAHTNLVVTVDPVKHVARTREVLRQNVPYGDQPGGWLPRKPDNADDIFTTAMQRRAAREQILREQSQAQAVAAGTTAGLTV